MKRKTILRIRKYCENGEYFDEDVDTNMDDFVRFVCEECDYYSRSWNDLNLHKGLKHKMNH